MTQTNSSQSSNKKKLLIVTSTFPKGCDDEVTARFVFDLALALKKYYQVFVVAPHSVGAKTSETVDGLKVERFRYFFPDFLQGLTTGSGMLSDAKTNPLAILQLPFFLIAEFLTVLRVLKREKIDVINSHWMIPQGLICTIVKAVTGVVHIATVHAAGVFLLKRLGAPGRMLARFIETRSDKILPVSLYIKSEVKLLTSGLKDYSVIPMGVDGDKFFKHPDKREDFRLRLGLEDKFTFLFVGKFAEKKGIPVLLESGRILKSKRDNFKIVIIGGGILEKKLKAMTEALGLDSVVEFKGWIKNNELPSFYAASDIVVVPSIFDSKGETEGMPVVVNEALAAGAPVIASNISGIPDTVKPGINGWLFAPGSSEALAELMAKAMDLSRNELNSYKSNALNTSTENYWENIARRYSFAIESVGL